MATMKINLSAGLPVPEGDYLVEVDEVVVREKQDGTSEYLAIHLRVVEGERSGMHVEMIASLRSDLAHWLTQTLYALGVEGDEVEFEMETRTLRHRDEEQVVIAPDLVGRRAVATVVHREFGGMTRTRVTRLRRA